MRDCASGAVLWQRSPERVVKTASVGKLFVLAELAARMADGRVDPGQRLPRAAVPLVRDPGRWWRLRQDDLTIDDIATLVGAVSDNWATNVLIDFLGLAAVQDRARSFGYAETQLHDFVRDERTADHPATLSTGCAADLCDFMARRVEAGGPERAQAEAVRRWLYASVDHSMQASAFALHPLVSGDAHPVCRFLNKTGSDDGVRGDIGLYEVGERAYAYAVIANWQPHEVPVAGVLSQMRAIGGLICNHAEQYKRR